MPYAVQAKSLTKRYGSFTAVNAIDFDVPHGTCFGILGPNGAGKTSTIHMITCRFPPTSGHLRVLDMDTATDARLIKDRLGFVPQENNLDEDLSLKENLELYGLYFGLSSSVVRRRTRELLEFMLLSKKSDEQIKALSGGMKRRAMIARALMNEPRLVVLDEPTTGLDPQARVLLWDRLRDLKHEGITLLLTTHYMDEAERLCDDIVIMHEGRIIDQASPDALIQRHVGRWTAELQLAADDALHSKVERSMNTDIIHWELTGSILHLFADDDEALLAATNALDPVGYHIRPANLEDVFLVRTGREIDE